MKREDSEDMGSGRAQPSANGLALEKIAPTLARYMLDVEWDDGEPRMVCWVKLKMEAGMFTAELSDPNYARVMRLQVETWTELIPALEAALKASPRPWQAAPWLERMRPKKGRRKKT